MLSRPGQCALLQQLEQSLDGEHFQWLLIYYRCKLNPNERGQTVQAFARAASASVQTTVAINHEVVDRADRGLLDRAWIETNTARRRDDGACGSDASTASAACAGTGETNITVPASALELSASCDMLTAAAEYEYAHGRFQSCYQLSSCVLSKDPFAQHVLPVHLCSMVRLDHHSELFSVAHQLVEEYPGAAVSWYAVGCYYYTIGDFENARRFYSKATTTNHRFAQAWMGFGHAFAAQDESDQAMAAYRTASRLFPGSYLPWLGIGMEYLRTNHLHLALQYIRQALEISPVEPLVLHELGVLHYLNGEYDEAVAFFKQVAQAYELYDESVREPSVFNLGHAYRKQREYEDAAKWYRVALSMNSDVASAYSALGFTLHLSGDLNAAIELYHQALSRKADDTFTCEMLSEALQDALNLTSPVSVASFARSTSERGEADSSLNEMDF